MKQYRVGILGATGMVGQRLVTLLAHHPWFSVTVLAASSKSAGLPYHKAVEGRWSMDTPIPKDTHDMPVYDLQADAHKITSEVDFVFCAINMTKDEIRTLEEHYALLECPVVSNNSAHRWTEDVPMIVPEINPEHTALIPSQRKRLGTKRGFIAAKSNCSLQSYVPALHPLRKFGLEKVLVCTYQAISGAGKTFDSWPDMIDNCIPYIAGEEEKSESEPMKLWGTIREGVLIPASTPSITAQCIRVPCSDGHLAACFMKFKEGHKPTVEQIKVEWQQFYDSTLRSRLPSAPKHFLHYFSCDDRPQTKLDRMTENGMAISVGRLRPDTQYDYKFVCLSHNTLRGAAGGAILLAELLCAEGYI